MMKLKEFHSRFSNRLDFSMDILAKSNPPLTLLKHTEDCLAWLKQVFIWKAGLIKKIAIHYKILESLLIQRIFLTVAFHDVGKSNKAFQFKIRKQSHGQESHALASTIFIFHHVEHSPIFKIGEQSFYPEVFAVVSHHAKLHKYLFDGYEKMKMEFADEAYYQTFYEQLNHWATKLSIPDWKPIVFDKAIFRKAKPGLQFIDDIFLPFREIEEFDLSNKERDVFLLLKSCLHYADWLASSDNTSYKYTQSESYTSITQKMQSNVPGFKQWNAFQDKAAKTTENLFVQIPTGQGKTEAATLWAVNRQEPSKILFLLPTMVTTNKMRKRMLTFFGDDNVVGLSHGTAQYILKNEVEDSEDEALRQHYLYNRTFFKPVTVATIDQLIYSFFNWGYWVLTGATSYNASIVIDEIHVYDAYTFGLLLEVINCIKPFNSRFAIMSASLPTVLKREIEKILPDCELIHEPSFDSKQRHIIEIKQEPIETTVSEVLADYKNNLKVLIVCNTIKKAREIYDMLVEKIDCDHLMLYHSQFILRDKRKKEDELEKIGNLSKGFIAVCTQIVEVSLDIDFDSLYTENAPIDALIQRLGRVNRKGQIGKRLEGVEYAKVVITQESENSRKYVYKNVPAILEETFKQLKQHVVTKKGNLNEADLKNLVEVIYTKSNLGEQYFKEIQDARKFLKKLWQNLLHYIYTLSADEKQLESISSRKSDYITIEAIPLRFYMENDLEGMVKDKKFDLIRDFVLKVPIHVARNHSKGKTLGETNIFIIDLKYNYDEGLLLQPDDQNII